MQAKAKRWKSHLLDKTFRIPWSAGSSFVRSPWLMGRPKSGRRVFCRCNRRGRSLENGVPTSSLLFLTLKQKSTVPAKKARPRMLAMIA